MIDFSDLDRKEILKYGVMVLIPLIIILFFIFYPKINDPDFYVADIPEDLKQELIDKKKWQESCPIPLNRLKIINIKYHASRTEIKRNGKFIILDVIAKDSLKLFKNLFKQKVIIEKINYITDYEDHQNSIINNNSLSFICDSEENNRGFLYSYGLAFDLNPLYNPALLYKNSDEKYAEVNVLNMSSRYINRSVDFDFKNEKIVDIFRKYGFSEWGGRWNHDTNWQYFAINPVVANIMLSMEAEDSEKFFQIIVDNIKFVDRFDKSEFATEIRYLYQKNRKKFLIILKKNFSALKKLTDSQFFDLLRKKINND